MNNETEKKIAEIHATVVLGMPSDEKLRRAARAVVDARHYGGDDGWDLLKNAIGELEDIVGRSNNEVDRDE